MLDDLARRMRDALYDRVRIARAQLDTLAARLAPRQLKGYIRQMMQRNDDLSARMLTALRALIRSRRERLDGLGGKLHSLSPLAVLDRGYSVTRAGKTVLRRAGQVNPGEPIETILFKGKLTSRVEHVEPSDGKEEDR
jgi:exodeoxyribonuclease VII large subunit